MRIKPSKDIIYISIIVSLALMIVGVDMVAKLRKHEIPEVTNLSILKEEATKDVKQTPEKSSKDDFIKILRDRIVRQIKKSLNENKHEVVMEIKPVEIRMCEELSIYPPSVDGSFADMEVSRYCRAVNSDEEINFADLTLAWEVILEELTTKGYTFEKGPDRLVIRWP